MTMKKNDWIVASVNNPDFTPEDFRDIGMNLDNTQILPMEQYISSQFITENKMFQNDQGEFSKDKFQTFYKQKLSDFNNFQTSDPNSFEYDMFDSNRFDIANKDKQVKVKDPNFKIEKVSNPDRITTGIAGVNQVGRRTLTPSEIAQTQKIYDPETDQFLDITPNDNSLIENPLGYIKELFNDPLVLATYDEDGEHEDPITHNIVKHKKGDYKLNSEGTYYTERLNGRSLIGKHTISAFDTITVDGEGINKYDFFDSDSLDKSVTGTIAKTAAAVAPLFIPGVNSVYSWLLVARETAKTLLMLGGMVGSLFGVEKDSPVLNTIAAIGQKFTGGTSEYSQQNTLTFENIANLMSDVATQWGQQKAIAKGVQALRGGKDIMKDAYSKAYLDYTLRRSAIKNQVDLGQAPASMLDYIGDPKKWQDSPLGKAAIQKFIPQAEKLARKNARLGADASLVYMALVSNTDVYQSMLEHGATKKEAAAVALGSAIGMFSVDKYLGLGEMFFDDLTTNTQRQIRGALRKEISTWDSSFQSIIKNPETTAKHKLGKLLQTGRDMGKKTISKYAEDLKYHSLGLGGKALGEGLEEVSEELVADVSKQLYELAGDLGFNTSTDDVGAWENAFPRYGMSLLGGALGGGMFHAVEVAQNGHFKRDTTQDELIYLVRNKKTKDLLQELENWKEKGKLGSTVLSASKYDTDDAGKVVYLTTDEKQDSQNQFVYDRIKESIFQLESIINNEGVNLSDDELFRQMILSESRFLALKDFLQDQSYSTGYQQTFQNIVRKLIDAEKDYALASKTKLGVLPTKVEDTQDGQTQNLSEQDKQKRAENLAVLQKKIDEYRAQRDSFLSGQQSLPYTRKMLFAIDNELNKDFLSMTYEQWLKNNHDGKTIEDLTPAEAEKYKEEYLQYKQDGSQKNNLDLQFQTFLNIEKLITPQLLQIQQNEQAIRKYSDTISKLFKSNFAITNWNTKLEDETDEQYNNRNIKLQNESDEDYNNRRQQRFLKVQELRNEQGKSLYEQVLSIINESGGFIDPITQRRLHISLDTRKRDMLQEDIDDAIRNFGTIVEAEGISNIAQLNQAVISEIKKLSPDLSNKQEIAKAIRDIVVNPHKDAITRKNTKLSNFRQGLLNIFGAYNRQHPDAKFEYDESNIDKQTITRFLTLVNQNLGFTEEQLYSIDEISSFDLSEDELNRLEEDGVELEDAPVFSLDSFGNQIREEEVVSILQQIRQSDEFSLNILDNDQIQQLAEQRAEGLLSDYMNLLDSAVANIEQDPLLQMITEVDQRSKATNPIISLVKSLALHLNKDASNIENVLQSVFSIYQNQDSPQDFILNEPQLQSFQEAEYLLNLAKKYIYAASTQPNLVSPVGHNTTINEFAEKHKDIFPEFQPLATISDDIASIYLHELTTYTNEIETWRQISEDNQANKTKKFQNAEKEFNKSRLQFYNVNRDYFKFILDGQETDLLEGFEAIPDIDVDSVENLIQVNQVENLLYDNIHKLLDKGYTLEKILKQSLLLQKITNVDDIIQQKTSELSDTVTYDKWTSYDKAIYLLSTIALKSQDFNTFLRSRIQQESNIVPLTIQEYVSRLAISSIAGRDIMKQGLKYLQSLSPNKHLALLDNFVFVDGAAGVGKSQVIARNVSNYVNSDNIWLSAPEETQLKTLQGVIGKGKTKLRKDLLEYILDPTTYANIMSDLQKSKSDYFKIEKGGGLDGADTILLDTSKLTFNEADPPELIIIDEVTHFSSIELQILNAYADKHNIPILALGNSYQNGFHNQNSLNIDREVTFTVRPPKMIISLRDTNLQKQSNLETTISILSKLELLSNAQDDPLIQNKIASLWDQVQNIRFRVYNQGTIHGDLITDSLILDDAKKLTGSVGYIGDTDSETYKTLVSAGIQPIVRTVDNVQGQEFDYVVVDKQWSIKDPQSESQIYRFMQDLYTMMSRGKTASIFIDRGLSTIIGNNRNEYSTALAPSMKEAVEQFRTSKLETLDKMLKQQESNPQPAQLVQAPQEDPVHEDNSLTDNYIPPSNRVAVQESLNRNGFNFDQELQRVLDTRDIIAYEDLPIRIYGATHLSGFKRVKAEDGTYVYSRDSITRRDLGIFTDQLEVNSNDIDNLVKQLLDLKSVILFKKGWNSLPSSIQEIISEEAFNSLQFKIEVRPENDTDNFVGYTGLRKVNDKGDQLFTINGLVYTLVGTYKNGNGEDCVITLGALARPDTYAKRLPELQSYISQQIEEAQTQEEKEKLAEFKNIQLPDRIRKYEQLLSTMAQQYNNQKDKENLYFDVTPQFSGLTHLRKVTSGGREVKTVDLASFRKSHPYTVVSDVYIYTGEIPGVSESIRGRAVVFVSSDTTLNQDELVHLYLSQKDQTEKSGETNPMKLSHSPSVRMIVLNNTGVSFQSLTDPRLADIYSTQAQNTKHTDNGDEAYINMLPFERDYMGSRMLVSMWNFRANLQRFLQEYNRFLTDNNLSEEQMNKIIDADRELYIQYENKYTNEQLEEFLKANGLTLNQYNLLNRFNDSLANKVRQFRLGGSQDGRYIRKLTNISSDNIYYKDTPNPTGIYIDPRLATHYMNLLQALFNIVDHLVVLEQKDGQKWPTDRLVSPKDANVINSLSGLIKGLRPAGNELSVQDSDTNNVYTLKFPDRSETALIPTILTTLYRYVKRYQASLEGEFDPSRNKLFYKDGDGKTVYLEYNPVLKLVRQGIDSTGLSDKRLSDMFSLMFHGTTNKLSDEYKATDAYFKNGFYVDPMSADVSVEQYGQAIFKKCATNEALLDVDVEVDMPVCDVFLSQTTQSSQTTKSNAPVQTEIPKAIISREQKQLLITQLDQLGLNSSIVDDSLQSSKSIDDMFTQIVITIREEILDNVEANFTGNNVNLDSIVDVQRENDSLRFTTLREYINSTQNVNLSESQVGVCKDGEFNVSLSDNEIVSVKYNTISKQLDIQRASTQPETPDSGLQSIKELIKNFNRDLQDEDIKSNTQYQELIKSIDSVDINYIRRSIEEIKNDEYLTDEALDALDNLIDAISEIQTNCKI